MLGGGIMIMACGVAWRGVTWCGLQWGEVERLGTFASVRVCGWMRVDGCVCIFVVIFDCI